MPAAASAGELRDVKGTVAINGQPASRGAAVKALDVVTTGAASSAIVVMNRDVLLVRPSSEIEILGKARSALLTGLRMLTGGVLGVFGKGGGRQLLTSTATIGIRGTGLYLEASAEETYICTCYGEVLIEDQHRQENRLVLAGYHTPNLVFADSNAGAMMQKAGFRGHTDDELVMLEKIVGRRPPFRKP